MLRCDGSGPVAVVCLGVPQRRSLQQGKRKRWMHGFTEWGGGPTGGRTCFFLRDRTEGTPDMLFPTHTLVDRNTMTTSKISQQDDKVTPRHARRTGPAYQILRRETSALGQDIPSAVATTQCNLPHKPSPHIRSSNKRPPRLSWAGPEALFSAMGTAVRIPQLPGYVCLRR